MVSLRGACWPDRVASGALAELVARVLFNSEPEGYLACASGSHQIDQESKRMVKGRFRVTRQREMRSAVSEGPTRVA